VLREKLRNNLPALNGDGEDEDEEALIERFEASLAPLESVDGLNAPPPTGCPVYVMLPLDTVRMWDSREEILVGRLVCARRFVKHLTWL
jgi:hypothetical protein